MSIRVFKKIALRQQDFSCEILANYGAALNSYKYKEQEFVDGYMHPNQIQEQQYKGVILAPFPNRTAKARYSFKNKEYKLHINREKESLALHGLLYNQNFEVLSQSEHSLKLAYDYDRPMQGYPFKFSLEINYTLKEDGTLKVISEVENKGGSMPFGMGWHPYFSLGESINNLKLKMPPVKKIVLDDALIPTGEEIEFCPKAETLQLADHHFDDCFRLLQTEQTSFKLESPSFALEVKASRLSEYPYFQIYTPKNRMSIAIEPMSCAPDALNNNMGLLILEPQEKKTFSYELKAHRRK